jgi:hypothetical protein
VEPISLRTPLALLLISLGLIASVWWWLATPIALPRAPIDPNAKLLCVSYAPFRDTQTPLVPSTRIPAEQIAQDLADLAKVTDCVRTYSIENGLDQVPALAAKVASDEALQGIAAAYAGMEAARTPEELLEPDLAFHRRIAEATNNDLLAYIGNMLSLALRESIKLSSKHPNTHALSLPRHKAILTALLHHDPLAAHQATLVQLNETREDITEILESGLDPR